MACGISDDTFANWRRKDADFAKRVEVASGKTELRLLKKIDKNADENFSAAAWLLERRFPENFSRPEIQLGVAMQFNSTRRIIRLSLLLSKQHRFKSVIRPSTSSSMKFRKIMRVGKSN